jgi:hypothetical protein
MKRLPFYAFVSFFVLLYMQGVCRRAGVPKLMVDGMLLALPLVALWSQPEGLRKPAPGFLFIWFYLGWSLSACIINDEGVVRGLLYSRFLITTYLVFWAAWNSRFTPRQLFWIQTVILVMFVVQVPAALLNWLVLGGKIESIVGTMEAGGGGIAAIFPMFAFSCMLALFLYYNRPLFLVAGLSFFLVGHASDKLAIYYFIPLMLVLGLVRYATVEGIPIALRRSAVVAVLAVCSLPFVLFLLSHTRRAENLQNEVGLFNKIAAFVNYTRQTSLQDESWYTTTRSRTSLRIIEETFRREPSVFLFGQGTQVFGTMSGQLDEGAYDKYGIIYGTVGWAQDALAVGWPAIVAHVGFYAYLLRLLPPKKRRGALTRYWKAIRLTAELGFCVFMIDYFMYSSVFTIGGWLSSVYVYFLAVLLAPQYQGILTASPIRVRHRSFRPFRRRTLDPEEHRRHLVGGVRT